jgi:hypothetical protein
MGPDEPDDAKPTSPMAMNTGVGVAIGVGAALGAAFGSARRKG